ncbi:DUF3047 domain-containing protein [Aestuariirhabdus sp. Z084]|uniref:DUF3047 domain-containing protein n=1 Tax=Aestuariirhabdus haliotis TaxID=2918751 RepID=UPI00201B354F|nr:DUF3047 domain-containing protein [Aestuariirhabdus haliotis]MCL6416156.1 DUF3047 domain-containing protein [Aestuariirhabdus haliotis]MCL6420087.1 DUF3047 domain-containing protein [Aestuariirhabdus haliotis]
MGYLWSWRVVAFSGLVLAAELWAQQPLLDLRQASADGPIPEAWQPLTFSGLAPTDYRLVEEGERVILCGVANASASGLVRRIDGNTDHFPEIAWEWRVSNVYSGARLGDRAGDDYPARLYVTFAFQPERADWSTRLKYESYRVLYGEYPPHSVLNYVWANSEAPETFAISPYADNSIMLAVQGGEQYLNQWQFERRHIADDYRKVFGEDPPPISGVALMSDADNTGQKATACFASIELLSP